jgi:hypothetical protein
MSGWIPEVVTTAAASRAHLNRMTPSENADLRERMAGQPQPIIPAYWLTSDPVQIVFWCPWCRKVHLHGAAGGDGGRVAHCHKSTSPLYGHGVELLHAGTVKSAEFAPRYSQSDLVRIWTRLASGGGR